MKKKSYVAPDCFFVELETTSMISARFDVLTGSKDGVSNMGSNNRRGEWGDLWADNNDVH